MLSFAGSRDSYTADIYDWNAYGCYWSSSPYGDENLHNARYLFLVDSSNVRVDDGKSRALGYSVRCFKDTPKAIQTLTLTFDANGGHLS